MKNHFLSRTLWRTRDTDRRPATSHICSHI